MNNMTKLTAAFGALALILCTASADAHVPFLKPNQFTVTHNRLHVESAFTEYPFQADFAMDSPHFSLLLPDGKQNPITPIAKTRAAVYLEPVLPMEGTYRVSTGVRKGPAYHAVETKEGKLYFSNDMDRVSGVRTSMQYFSRADVYLTKGTASYQPIPVNKGVEILPLSAPNDLVLGQEIRLRVLRDGKPAKNARVVNVHEGEHYALLRSTDLYDVENKREGHLYTNDAGELTFRPTQAGMYFLFVTLHQKISDTLWESHNAALTLNVNLAEATHPHP